MSFPIDPFEDAPGQLFTKDNKKEVSEDFVAENFKALGWEVSLPIRDTGIDLIISKYVCPDGHTKLDGRPFDVCDECTLPLMLITRFIQVKTRATDKENLFGYTLKTKDFPTDPRHVFLFYSDQTTQFLIFPIYEYLYARHQLTENDDYSPLGVSSMRQDNYKKNEFKVRVFCTHRYHNRWNYISDRSGNDVTSNHVDLFGLESISTPQIEQNLPFLTEQIREMKLNQWFFYNYKVVGRRTELRDQNDVAALRAIALSSHQNNLANINNQRIQNRNDFIARNRNDVVLLESVSKSWIQFPELRRDLEQRRP